MLMNEVFWVGSLSRKVADTSKDRRNRLTALLGVTNRRPRFVCRLHLLPSRRQQS